MGKTKDANEVHIFPDAKSYVANDTEEFLTPYDISVLFEITTS